MSSRLIDSIESMKLHLSHRVHLKKLFERCASNLNELTDDDGLRQTTDDVNICARKSGLLIWQFDAWIESNNKNRNIMRETDWPKAGLQRTDGG